MLPSSIQVFVQPSRQNDGLLHVPSAFRDWDSSYVALSLRMQWPPIVCRVRVASDMTGNNVSYGLECGAGSMAQIVPITLSKVTCTVSDTLDRHLILCYFRNIMESHGIIRVGQFEFGRVSACEPVHQGLIDATTEICIEESGTVATEVPTAMAEPERLLSYMGADVKIILKSVAKSYSVLPYGFEECMDNVVCISNHDLSGFGGFSPSMVRKCLVAFPLNWKVSISYNGRSRIVACASEPSPQPGTIALTCSLLYNLTGDTEPKPIEVRIVDAGAWPEATKVEIAAVRSPASSERGMHEAGIKALQAYLRKRPVVYSGDMICVGGTSSMLDGPAILPDTVFFYKVQSIEVDGEETQVAQINPDTSRVMQQTWINVRIPRQSRWLELEPFNITSNLHTLLEAAFSKRLVERGVAMTILVKGNRLSGKRTLVIEAADAAGFHVFDINCYAVLGENQQKLEGILRARMERAITCAPCLILLRHIEALKSETPYAIGAALGDSMRLIVDTMKEKGFPVALVATTSDDIPDEIAKYFRQEIKIPAPSEDDRVRVLQSASKSLVVKADLRQLARKTAALGTGDLAELVQRAKVFALNRVQKQTGASKVSIISAGFSVENEDLEAASKQSLDSYSESIGAPKIPTVKWDDVGGLASVKEDILDTIQLPLMRPELFSSGLKKRSGVLLYGPPGTGKTLLAKAVATSFSLNFYSVKGPELLNMYIGESEANVRRVFQRARDAKPCVIFFDELDSVAPKRGNQGDSGGVMDRIVSQLLAELDGMSNSSGDVFVIGATNRPDLLDPALLRPGRFDKMLYLGIPDTNEAQLNVLSALVKRFKLAQDVDLRQIVERCTFTFTGADFYALSSDAMLSAMSRKAEEVDKIVKTRNIRPQQYFDELSDLSALAPVVEQADFIKALAGLVPSVSQQELEHYLRIKQIFSPSQGVVETQDKGKGKGTE